MAKGSANLTDIDAVRRLKPALLEFVAKVSSALVSLDLESRRPMEWIEHDRGRFWPREAQRAGDAVIEARTNLERCRMALRDEDRRSCVDERKALEKAKRRLEFAEIRVRALPRWRNALRKEVEEFQVQIARLQQYLDLEFQRAVASLARITQALDHYALPSAPTHARPGAAGDSSSAASASSAEGPPPGAPSP